VGDLATFSDNDCLFNYVGGLLRVPTDGVPYPVFAYTALLPWNFFAAALARSRSVQQFTIRNVGLACLSECWAMTFRPDSMNRVLPFSLVQTLRSYHLIYDNLLIVFSEVALYRTVRQRQFADSTGALAAVLLTLTVLLMLPPTRLFLFWPSLFRAAEVFVWLCVLVFLISQAMKPSSAAVGPSAPGMPLFATESSRPRNE